MVVANGGSPLKHDRSRSPHADTDHLAAAGVRTLRKTASNTIGSACWYGDRYHGRQTASGATFDTHQLTAAHRALLFGSRVRVTDTRTGRSVSDGSMTSDRLWRTASWTRATRQLVSWACCRASAPVRLEPVDEGSPRGGGFRGIDGRSCQTTSAGNWSQAVADRTPSQG